MRTNYLLWVTAFMTLLGVFIAAGSTPENITTSMCAFYNTLRGALAVGMMLLVVLAAITYAVGQMMGAETRARASVWATAMFVGALVGALIYIIMPYILSFLAPELFGGTPGKADISSVCSTSSPAVPGPAQPVQPIPAPVIPNPP